MIWKIQIRWCVLSALVLCTNLILHSCATSRLEVPVTRAAEINTSKYKRVFIGSFKNATTLPNPQGKVEFALTNALAGTGRFDVLDKEAYENFMRGNNGKTDDILVINGVVSRFKGSDNVTKGEASKDKDGKTNTPYTRIVNIAYGIQFKVSQASTAKVLGTREISTQVSDNKRSTNVAPPLIDTENLLSIAESNIIRDFLKKIVPHQETVEIDLYSDKDLPQLEQGIEEAKKGRWDEALDLFKRAIERSGSLKPEQQAMAVYNAGIAEMFTYQFEAAKKHLSRAMSLDSKNSQYAQALEDCNKLEAEYRKVQEQNLE